MELWFLKYLQDYRAPDCGFWAVNKKVFATRSKVSGAKKVFGNYDEICIAEGDLVVLRSKLAVGSEI